MLLQNKVIEGKDLEGAEYKSTRNHQAGVDNTAVQIIDEKAVEELNEYNTPERKIQRQL